MSSGTSIVGSVKASGRKQPRPTKLGGGNASSAANASGLAMVSSVKSGGAASLSMFDDLQLGTLPVAGLASRYVAAGLRSARAGRCRQVCLQVGPDLVRVQLEAWMTVATVWVQVFEVVLRNSSADLSAAELVAAACRKVFDEFSGELSQ